MPQLNTANATQYRWLQFLVWRRFLTYGAIGISILILLFQVADVILDSLLDVTVPQEA